MIDINCPLLNIAQICVLSFLAIFMPAIKLIHSGHIHVCQRNMPALCTPVYVLAVYARIQFPAAVNTLGVAELA